MAAVEELNGDTRLSSADRLRYLWRNLCRNLSAVGRGPATRKFSPAADKARAMAAGQSPGRLLTELFIAEELPRLLAMRKADVIEIGCGSGSMADRLAGLDFSGRYCGVDIQDRFNRNRPKDFPFSVEFRQCDVHDFVPAYKADLMISVSALEHIPHDDRVIGRFPDAMKPGGMEVHVVPSGAGLAIYLFHGLRQYTPAALEQKFGADIEIVRLGGLGSYLLHITFITVSDLVFRRSLRKAAPWLYRTLLLGALWCDGWLPLCPSAYAVIRRH